MATPAEVKALLESTSLPVPLVDELLAGAAPLWLRAEPAEQVAADLALCHPGLAQGEVRAFARALTGGRHLVSVVAEDRPGLLAATAGCLAAHDLSISSVAASSWPQLGLAVQRVVAAPVVGEVPWPQLGADLRACLAGGQPPAISFDPCRPVVVEAVAQGAGRALVSVEAPDRVGLLWAAARWFEAQGCNIEAARAASEDGVARDTFLVTGVVDPDALASHLAGRDAPAVPWPVAAGLVAARGAAGVGSAVARTLVGAVRPRP